MRQLIFAINLSLDGCCDHSKFNPDDEVHDYFTQLSRDAGTFVYGRTTYELMVPFWPDLARHPSEAGNQAELDFARAFDAIEQIVVFSRSLPEPEDPKTRVVRSGLKEELLRLKQQTGKAILTGGVDIPSQLMQLGLIDEYHIVVHPVVIGAGRRLFDQLNLQEFQAVQLVSTRVFGSGAVAMHYRARM